MKENDDELLSSSNEEDNGGSILGASLLFAGTAIGASAIALPVETAQAGFIPSIVGLVICWVYTYVTSLVTLKASWLSTLSLSSKTSSEENFGGTGFLSISKSLGVIGEIVTAMLFWFLLTAIIVAYTSKGGQLISISAKEVISVEVNPAFGSIVFATFFATLVIKGGTTAIDAINRIFVFGLVATFMCLVGYGIPNVEASNLISHSDWNFVYPNVISIGILSLGAQNLVPTLLQYLDYDTLKTQRAILFGSILPLVLYIIWESIFFGLFDGADGTKMEMWTMLGQVGGTVVSDLVEVFSFCAIGSSMAGASVSLVDFFDNGINMLSNQVSLPSKTDTLSRNLKPRILAAALALGPPVILAYAYPDLFLVALEEAGLPGGVSLYGIILAIAILSLCHHSSSEVKIKIQQREMPGKLIGGDVTIICLIIISLVLVLQEIRHLF